MRVLMIAWEYPPHLVGGLGAHVAGLSPELATAGAHVTVLTPLLAGGEVHETTREGVRIVRVALPPSDHHDLGTFVAHTNNRLELAAHIIYTQCGGFDIIHTHDWLTAASSISLKKYWHIPLLATIHATERGRGQGNLQGEIANHINNLEWQLSYEAWRVIVCSSFMKQQLKETLGTPFDKMDVIPNGINSQQYPFQNDEERQTFRRTYAADDEAIIFYVGRIVYEKGLHILIDSYQHIRKHTKAHIVIAGTGHYIEPLKNQAQALGISDVVTFTGFISDEELNRLYHVADVATFPSLYEPFGIVVLQAFASGTPVVVSRTGGLMEIVEDRRTGLTVTPGDAYQLALGIAEIIQQKETTKQYIANASEVLHNLYSWKQIAYKTRRIYDQIYQEWQASSWGKQKHSVPCASPSLDLLD